MPPMTFKVVLILSKVIIYDVTLYGKYRLPMKLYIRRHK